MLARAVTAWRLGLGERLDRQRQGVVGHVRQDDAAIGLQCAAGFVEEGVLIAENREENDAGEGVLMEQAEEDGQRD